MQNYMRKICLAVLAALMIALAGQAALAATYSAKVLTSSMDVYLSPNSAAAPAGSLVQGTSFSVHAISGEWAYISYRGNTGYAEMKNIMFDDAISGYTVRDTGILFITHESYSRRVSYRAKLAAGTRIYVRGVSHGLLLVTNANGTILGFVSQADCVRG
ncbi:MAG: hypothetical protein Q4D43_07030 [Clostridia bacterium]|nr:hypothetical protein [Clostridia bacterium]